MNPQSEDTIRISAIGVMHSIRNRQEEYSSARKKNQIIAETYCGRHRIVSERKLPSEVTCRTCAKALMSEPHAVRKRNIS